MSDDLQHNRENESGDWLKHSWDSWDAGAPSESVWEELEASVVSESVWNRVNASLETEEHHTDNWIVASHDDWNPSNGSDVWERLNESISLEQVWNGLDQSLSRRVAYRPSYWKIAVASVVALLISTRFMDSPVQISATSEEVEYIAENDLTDEPGTSFSQETSRTQVAVQHQPNIVPVVVNPVVPKQEPDQQLPVQQQIVSNRTLKAASRSYLTTGRKDFTALSSIIAANNDNTLPSLVSRTDVFPDSWNNIDAALAVHNGERPMPFNHWTAQVGAQLSILQERNQSLLTSTLPRFGLAADMSYRHRVGPFQLIHSIGVSQYSQALGKYVNGRHLITSQQVNAVQVHSTVGYSYKRFTLYGGLLVSKMLNGLEQNENTVTNVYDFGRLQAGLTAGIDVRLFTFPRSGNQLSFGSQYQWIPSGNGAKSSFENIQGLRFQTKFSF